MRLLSTRVFRPDRLFCPACAMPVNLEDACEACGFGLQQAQQAAPEWVGRPLRLYTDFVGGSADEELEARLRGALSRFEENLLFVVRVDGQKLPLPLPQLGFLLLNTARLPEGIDARKSALLLLGERGDQPPAIHLGLGYHLEPFLPGEQLLAPCRDLADSHPGPLKQRLEAFAKAYSKVLEARSRRAWYVAGKAKT